MKKVFTFPFISPIFIILWLFSINASSQPGTSDPTFNPADVGFGRGDGANGNINATAMQDDERIIIGGAFTSYNTTIVNRIARVNQDGTLDLTFNPGTGFNNTVEKIVLQYDGKIIAYGSFTTFNGVTRNGLARLNSDGTLDSSFDPGTGFNNQVSSIAVLPGNKLVFCGLFTSYNGSPANLLARLNTNGTLDTGLNIGTGFTGSNSSLLRKVAVQNDGKIVVAGFFTGYNGQSIHSIIRLNSDGTRDTGFSTALDNVGLYDVVIHGDGRMVINGAFNYVNGLLRNTLARLNSGGSVDANFNYTGGSISLGDIKLINDTWGYIIKQSPSLLTKLNFNGSVNTSWSFTSTTNVLSTSVLFDNRFIIGGSFTAVGTLYVNRLARLDENGLADPTYNPGSGINFGGISDIVQMPDGRILASGGFVTYNGVVKKNLARLYSDGALDYSFDAGLTATTSCVALQPDGKVLASGAFSNPSSNFVRLNIDGSRDANFNPNPNSPPLAIALQSDGKIIIGGSFTLCGGIGKNRIARINPDGTLDTNFNPGTGFNNAVNSIYVQSDGKIIVGGAFTSFNGIARNKIIRLNSDGTLDNSFTPPAVFNGTVVYSVITRPDGKVIMGGDFTGFGFFPQPVTSRNRIAVLNSDGSIDTGFNPGSGFNNFVKDVLLQPDGKIIAGGNFTAFNGVTKNYIVRLNSDGTIDPNFNMGSGFNNPGPNSPTTLALDNEGMVLAGGSFTSYNGIGRNRIAKIIGGNNVYLTLSHGILGGFAASTSAPSASKSFSVSGNNLTSSANISISNSDWELSLDNSTWSASLSLPVSNGTVSGQPVTVYVRLKQKVTLGNKNATLTVSSNGAYNRSINLIDSYQTITFDPLPAKKYGDAPFNLVATASSGLPVTFQSSNPAIASISGNTVIINATGAVTITVSQAGNTYYGAAPNVSRTLTVNKGDQVITFNLPNKAYGDPTFYLTATSNSGLTVTYPSSSNPNVATIFGPYADQVSIINAGTTDITASQPGNQNWNPAQITKILTVNKAALTVTATNSSKIYGASTPALTFTYSGFKGSDNSSVIDTPPSISTTALLCSNAGSYLITPTGGGDNNYTFSYVNGSLTINKATVNATADSKSKTFGQTNPTFSITYSGFMCGDDSNVIDTQPSISTSAVQCSNSGSYPITLSGGSDNNYNFNFINNSLIINKATLTTTADNQTKPYGTPNPSLTVSYSGFTCGDSQSALDSPPSTSTIAGQWSDVGIYPITLSGGSDNNYAISWIDGFLTVTRQTQTISFDQNLSECGLNAVLLVATASSGLPVTYTSLHPSVATISGSTAYPQGYGNADIVAQQNGSTNYYAATSVTRTLSVNPAPTITIDTNGATIFCQGRSVNLIANTGFVLSNYLWSTGATTASINVNTSGTYSVTVTNTSSNCSSTSSPVSVAVISNSGGGAITASAQCYDGENPVTLSTNPVGTGHLWSTGVTTASVSVSIPGVYGASTANYQVSYNINGNPATACYDLDPCIFLRVGTSHPKEFPKNSVAEEKEFDSPRIKELSAFPNPANNLITIVMPVKMENETPVLLYDMFGKTVNQGSIPKGEWKTDLSVTDLPDGIYVVRVGNGALINATKVRVRHQH